MADLDFERLGFQHQMISGIYAATPISYTRAVFFSKEFLMLEQLSVLSPDPILGLAAECRADPNPN
jgi:hypothetical protein